MTEHAEANPLNGKEETLREFATRLLTSEVAPYIARLIAFGSVAAGTARPESDIDLLIVGTGALSEISRVSAALAFEVALQRGESIQPLVYCVDEFRHPSSYFLWRVKRTGREVYAMEEDVLRRKEAAGYLTLAEYYLEGATRNLKAGDYRITVDTGYNAAELAVKGLLILRTGELPGSHGGLVQMFGKHYALQDPELKTAGRRLHLALEKRNKARYDVHAEITREDALNVLEVAETLVSRLSDLLAK